MVNFENPFKPGAGHQPPYLAGRSDERKEFSRLLTQQTITENLIMTGLRGVGKTVLLDSFKPTAIQNGWIWLGTDMSESTAVSEDTLALRVLTDIAVISSKLIIETKEIHRIGFVGQSELFQQRLTFDILKSLYDSTPGLVIDKLKNVLEAFWLALHRNAEIRGVIFAYDESQTLADQAQRNQYPLSLLLDTFQSIQRKNIPMMLILTGLPTLFPKLVETRTYSERMFRILFLKSLDDEECRQAILKPIQGANCPLTLDDESVNRIISMSGGYPYFIQYICREIYDLVIQKIDAGSHAIINEVEIERKLDSDFFGGRWATLTDRQRELLSIIARLDNAGHEFTVQEITNYSKFRPAKAFSSSHVSQLLAKLSDKGLVYKNRHGRYSFAIPLFERFILRQLGVND